MNQYKIFIACILIFLSFCSCIHFKPKKEKLDLSNYELVWADEFDGNKLDMNKWGHRSLGPRRRGINTEDSVSLNGKGQLLLTTSKSGEEYHTGMISTANKFETCYGYIECRVKLQTQPGHWTAFWMTSPAINIVGDREKGASEIDIFEYLGRLNNIMYINVHWDGYGRHHKWTGTRYYIPKLKKNNEYHSYGLLWTKDYYKFFVDGKLRWQTTKGISHVKEYIVLSMEVGRWAGFIECAELPDSSYFDYVRVYKLKK